MTHYCAYEFVNIYYIYKEEFYMKVVLTKKVKKTNPVNSGCNKTKNQDFI